VTNGRDASRGSGKVGASDDAVPAPISESGVRAANAPARRHTPTFRPLTPYQARLDVEMDDTAISKVRDPSVSIALGADAALHPRGDRGRRRFVEAAVSLGVGVVLGALVVVLVVLAVRAFGG
jgi:hypothetical protein